MRCVTSTGVFFFFNLDWGGFTPVFLANILTEGGKKRAYACDILDDAQPIRNWRSAAKVSETKVAQVCFKGCLDRFFCVLCVRERAIFALCVLASSENHATRSSQPWAESLVRE